MIIAFYLVVFVLTLIHIIWTSPILRCTNIIADMTWDRTMFPPERQREQLSLGGISRGFVSRPVLPPWHYSLPDVERQCELIQSERRILFIISLTLFGALNFLPI